MNVVPLVSSSAHDRQTKNARGTVPMPIWAAFGDMTAGVVQQLKIGAAAAAETVRKREGATYGAGPPWRGQITRLRRRGQRRRRQRRSQRPIPNNGNREVDGKQPVSSFSNHQPTARPPANIECGRTLLCESHLLAHFEAHSVLSNGLPSHASHVFDRDGVLRPSTAELSSPT